MEEKLSQKSSEISKLKSEHENKLKEYRKINDRELKFKSETQERE